MTSTRRPGRQGPGSVMTGMHRAIRTIKYVHQEQVRAMEAIFRPVGAPQHRGSPAGRASAPAAPRPSAAAADRESPASRAA
jgi:hypothetical protein